MNGERPTVYVVNRGGHSYDDARRYGDIVFMTEGSEGPLNVSNMVRTFWEAIKDSSPNDYILWSGPKNMNCVATFLWGLRHSGRLKVLIYRGDRYVKREIDGSRFLNSALSAEGAKDAR